MSLLAPGARCSICPLVDFLPFTCPHCAQVYCRDHIATHGCLGLGAERKSSIVGRLGRGKKLCELGGCGRESLESIAGLSTSTSASTAVRSKPDATGADDAQDIAREVRCPGCQGAFCVTHRAQTSHSCPAPLAHNERYDAFLDRRAKARELIAVRFPGHETRVVPKPPPAKDVVRARPMPSAPSGPASSPSTSASPSDAGTTSAAEGQSAAPDTVASDISTRARNETAAAAPPQGKTKADKLWDIQLRKIRSAAAPLIPSQSPRDRRFFEWIVDLDKGRVEKWQATGRLDTKAERAWVGAETPVGKILDTLIVKGKVTRPKSDDPAQVPILLCLNARPDKPRETRHLDLSKSAAEEIVEGGLVVLVRGQGVRGTDKGQE